MLHISSKVSRGLTGLANTAAARISPGLYGFLTKKVLVQRMVGPGHFQTVECHRFEVPGNLLTFMPGRAGVKQLDSNGPGRREAA